MAYFKRAEFWHRTGYTGPAMKDVGLRIRVQRELREKFVEVCGVQDKPHGPSYPRVYASMFRRIVAQHTKALHISNLKKTTLWRAVGSIEDEDQLRAVTSALEELPDVSAALVSEIETLSKQVGDIVRESEPQEGLFGGTMPKRFRVVDQINMVYAYVEGSTAPPTEDQKRWKRRGSERLNEIVDQLTRLSTEALPALYQKLDQHGVAWTPGRSIPPTRR